MAHAVLTLLPRIRFGVAFLDAPLLAIYHVYPLDISSLAGIEPQV